MSEFRLPDGRPLDDAEPQDMARLAGEVFDRLARVIARGEVLDVAQREDLADSLSRGAAAMRAWVTFGRWPSDERAKREAAEKRVRETERETATLAERLANSEAQLTWVLQQCKVTYDSRDHNEGTGSPYEPIRSVVDIDHWRNRDAARRAAAGGEHG